MKLNEFKKKMIKAVFSVEEAHLTAWQSSLSLLKLQLHQWTKKEELGRLKRGLYYFPDRVTDRLEVVRTLYAPAYISLDYALNYYGHLPDVPFSLTLVTPRTPRRFKTPLGTFIYHKIKSPLFWGYHPDTLFGEREKVLLDFLYFNSYRLQAEKKYWDEMRWQNMQLLDFDKAAAWGEKFDNKKLVSLLTSLEAYSKRYGRS